MAAIYETENFIVESRQRPLVSRTEGGHLHIGVKNRAITDRTKLDPEQAIELMRLSMIVGEAFETAMINRGIPIVKINYQDMGNWAFKTGEKPYLHYHIFGRASNAVKQLWPESVYLPDRNTGFYDEFEPLNDEDILEIQKQIKIVEGREKHEKGKWKLVD